MASLSMNPELRREQGSSSIICLSQMELNPGMGCVNPKDSPFRTTDY